MNNLQNFNNLYLNLAQGAYPETPKQFPVEKLNSREQYILKSGQSLQFNFSSDAITDKGQTILGGQHLPNDGIVYLQPDVQLKAIPVQDGVTIQKGLLTDQMAGFNAYFLTDTAELNAETRNTYLAIRGSDGSFNILDPSNWNDWLGNNLVFTLGDKQVPQSHLATEGMKAKIAELRQHAPNAKLNITGHSLGTMVSVHGLAGLSMDELEMVEEVVLFNGPDTLNSLNQMGVSSEKIKAISEKVTYYVNPFDMVSMLNRTEPFEQQLGTVKVIIPLHFTTSFDNPSSHMFGGYQLDAFGNPLVASETFHPEFLVAGQKLAKLNQTAITLLRSQGVSDDMRNFLFRGRLDYKLLFGAELYDYYQKEYQAIIAETRLAAIKWNKENIPLYHSRIRSATGSQRIQLRSELLQISAQQAIFESEDQVKATKQLVAQAKEEVQALIQDTYTQVYSMTNYLSAWEIENILSSFQLDNVWNHGIEMETIAEAERYGQDVSEFSSRLVTAAERLEEVDRQGATFFSS